MQNRRDLSLSHPALIPIAGNYDKKARSLDRDVTTIGRARGSDLCMEANEISVLHCLIYRSPDGYRIRDCNSRCGTRVNGESIKVHLLHDTDIVNLGPFSFEFRLPPALFPNDALKVDPVQVEHLKRSRRKLANLALTLRKRQQGVSPREQEWAQKANLLKDKIRSYDQRLNELEEAEKELTDERQQLERELEAQRKRIQDVETKLAKRLAEADEEINAKWQAFQQRCHADESRALASQPVMPREPRDADEANQQLQNDLNLSREKLHQLEKQWSRQNEQWQREQQEFRTMKEQWAMEQAKSAANMEEKEMTLAQKEAAIRTQKTELQRMMGDIKRMQDDLRKQAKPDIRALHDEIERLQQENEELRNQPASDSNPDLQKVAEENLRLRVELESKNASIADDDIAKQLDDFRAEIALLSEELHNKEQIIQEFQNQSPGSDQDSDFVRELEQLRSENGLLRQLLDEKSSSDPSEPHIPQPPKGANDLERYENELNEYRRQLDTDRDKLNREVEMLRERNKELDEAIREMEMEMSKERAELARERMRLERVREEVKTDMERLQREVAVRDSMAPVQKLRDEISQKKANGNAKTDKPANDRLRTIRDLSNGS